MKEIKYAPQSYKWDAYVVYLPDEMVQAYSSGTGVRCSLSAAKDGNTTLVRVGPGQTFSLRAFSVDGTVSIVQGEGHLFLASRGSFSGGSLLHGAVALKPGAVVRFGAKGAWQYLVCNEEGIRSEAHDPHLFSEEGGAKWQPLG